jgi:hypothetical protein
MARKKQVNIDDVTWVMLQDLLRNVNSEDEAWRLLQAEVKGKRRLQHMLRIHARLNRLRMDRERSEIMAGNI